MISNQRSASEQTMDNGAGAGQRTRLKKPAIKLIGQVRLKIQETN